MFSGYGFHANLVVFFGLKWIKWGSVQGLLWSVAVHTVLPVAVRRFCGEKLNFKVSLRFHVIVEEAISLLFCFVLSESD
jgi:hypothetical protein